MTTTIEIEILMKNDFTGIPKLTNKFKSELLKVINSFYPDWKFVNYHSSISNINKISKIENEIKTLKDA